MTSLRSAVVLSLVGASALVACGSDGSTSDTPVITRQVINVGHTGDPVSELLAEIYGQGLENAGYGVGRKDPAADRAATLAALEAGSTQFVPELSATLLAHLAAASGTDDTAVTIDEQVAALDAALPDALTLGPVTGAEATQVVVCNQATISEHSLASISDLAGVAADVTVGVPADFQAAPSFGLDALNAAYETELTTAVVEVAEAAAQLAADTIGCAVVPQTLPAITVDGLIALDDDKNLFPLDVVVPLMTTIAATPDVVAVVTQINGSLTSDVLRALLVKAAVGDQSYDVIAKQFLASLSSGQ